MRRGGSTRLAVGVLVCCTVLSAPEVGARGPSYVSQAAERVRETEAWINRLNAEKAETQGKREETQRKTKKTEAEKESSCGDAKHLARERNQVIRELESGYYCSECNRAASQIEASGEGFEQHLGRVKGTPVPAPKSLVNEKAYEYAQKIREAERKCESAGYELDRLRNTDWQLKQRASEIENDVSRAEWDLESRQRTYEEELAEYEYRQAKAREREAEKLRGEEARKAREESQRQLDALRAAKEAREAADKALKQSGGSIGGGSPPPPSLPAPRPDPGPGPPPRDWAAEAAAAEAAKQAAEAAKKAADERTKRDRKAQQKVADALRESETNKALSQLNDLRDERLMGAEAQLAAWQAEKPTPLAIDEVPLPPSPVVAPPPTGGGFGDTLRAKALGFLNAKIDGLPVDVATLTGTPGTAGAGTRAADSLAGTFESLLEAPGDKQRPRSVLIRAKQAVAGFVASTFVDQAKDAYLERAVSPSAGSGDDPTSRAFREFEKSASDANLHLHLAGGSGVRGQTGLRSFVDENLKKFGSWFDAFVGDATQAMNDGGDTR